MIAPEVFITPVLGIAEVLRFTLLVDGCACVCVSLVVCMCDSFPLVCVFASFPFPNPTYWDMGVCVSVFDSFPFPKPCSK